MNFSTTEFLASIMLMSDNSYRAFSNFRQSLREGEIKYMTSPDDITDTVTSIERNGSESQRRVFAGKTQGLLDQRRDGFEPIIFQEDFQHIQPKKLFRILSSIVLKNALVDSKFSAVEIHLLHKIYTFLLTEEGKQILYNGIVETMNLPRVSLSPTDIEKIGTIESADRATSQAVAKKVAQVSQNIEKIAGAWGSVDGFTTILKSILIRYHKDEMESALQIIHQMGEHPVWIGSVRTFAKTYDMNAIELGKLGYNVRMRNFE